MMRFSYIFGM